MARLWAIAAVLAALVSYADAYAALNNWVLSFEDEFEGDRLNSSYWNVGDGQAVNGDFVYDAKQVFVQDGYLHLTTVEHNQTVNGTQYRFASGMLDTQGKVSQHQGRFEVRAKLPTGQGLWPAHWLMPDDKGKICWPCGGEIDIMELFDKTGSYPWNSTVFGTYHWAEPQQCGKDRWQGLNGHFPPVELQGAIVNFRDEFHVFAVEWDEKEIRWYMDDAHFHTRAAGFPPDLFLPTTPMYFILNTALAPAPPSGWGPGPGPAHQLPQEHVIDYVRIYKRKK